MYFIYIVSLILLLVILLLLRNEERAYQRNITHGITNKYWILREKRRFIRFDERIKIRYILVTNKNSDSRYSRSINISKTGLCLLTYEKLNEKDLLNIEIELHDFSNPVKVAGKVVWIKDLQTPDKEGRRLFYVGLQFIKISPTAEAMLLTHLNSLKTAV